MIGDLDSRMRKWRHHLHQHPELGFEERATSRYVAELRTSFGLNPQSGIGGTGVVASLNRAPDLVRSVCAPTWTACR